MKASALQRKKRLILFCCVVVLLFFFRENLASLFLWFHFLLQPVYNPPEYQSLHTHVIPYKNTLDCGEYGWKQRPNRTLVYDVVIFSHEIELLVGRFGELWDVVDVFLVFEATHTYSGIPKPLLFKKNKAIFQPFLSKIEYHQIKVPNEQFTAWQREGHIRTTMQSLVSVAKPPEGSLVLYMDCDEWPRADIISLLSTCQPDFLRLRLAMKTYRYSFEFLENALANMRPLAYYWSPDSDAHMIWPSRFVNRGDPDPVLFDAGWHCTWCFKYLSDFLWKMDASSHYDQATTSIHKLEEIQKVVCSGDYIFGEYYAAASEATNYVDLFGRLRPLTQLSKYTFADLPKFILKNRKYYQHLLPGNCTKEQKRADVEPEYPFIL